MKKLLPEILIITSYPPRECGIATYSQDLIKSLNTKFSQSFSLKVCALESKRSRLNYPAEVKYKLDTSSAAEYDRIARLINKDNNIKIVLIQHEFGLYRQQEAAFLKFLHQLSKPICIVFHTVLAKPDAKIKLLVGEIVSVCTSIIVMTRHSAEILQRDYNVLPAQISVIPHGTHLVAHLSEQTLKQKYRLSGRKVLTTFGLLSSGKSIETTLDAMPGIIKTSAEAVFLIIGKTHPEVVKTDGEQYREMLEERVSRYGLQDHVIFINKYLALPELLEYLQLTDIYLFTSSDPNQAVSGTFAYAMSCACPIISTPIPHALELLNRDTGILFDFHNAKQLSEAVNHLLNNDTDRRNISTNALQKIVATSWENSAISHALLFEKISEHEINIAYNYPPVILDHVVRMTTDVGIIQFSKINQPDIESGYTLDDNARALVAMCMQYRQSRDVDDIYTIYKYLNFIRQCQQADGSFQNYVDKYNEFTAQNQEVNLDDSNGRAIWALGFVTSMESILPGRIVHEASAILQKSLAHILTVHSTRAMAFAIKGIYHFYNYNRNPSAKGTLIKLARRLVQMYKHESDEGWKWFEGYLTYANSILPEAMLYAWLVSDDEAYKEIAISSMEFLISQIFIEEGIRVISNKNWLVKGETAGSNGEQPIDVAYTIMTLNEFYNSLHDAQYKSYMITAFEWFLGRNRLSQIIYNPCTGGCYDGMEDTHVNLNQGAESTVSYLMARLTIAEHDIHEAWVKFSYPAINQLIQEVKNPETESVRIMY